MRFEIKQASMAPIQSRRNGYDQVLPAVRNLRQDEALLVEPDEGKSLNSLKEGVKKALNRAAMKNFELRTDPDANALWVLRKGPIEAATPVSKLTVTEALNNGGPALPLGAAPVAAIR